MDAFSIDTHKLAYHPHRVSQLLEAKSDWAKHRELKPIYAELSTSGACNHRCTFCSVDYIGYKPIFIDFEVLERFFHDSSKLGLKAVMFAGDGEPLLHPRINDVVQLAHELCIDVSFTTNAVRLDANFIERSLKKVTWIKASVNAGDPGTYEKIHRTSKSDFDLVWKNLSKAVSHQDDQSEKKCTLGVQSLILPDNINSLDELAHRASDTGLDYLVLKPYVHNVYMNQPGYADIDYTENVYNETLARLSQKYNTPSFTVVSRQNALNKLKGDEDRYQTCWSTPALWFYVSGNSDVYACGAHVGNPNFLLGNIQDSSIVDIWQSENRASCLKHVQEELDLGTCRRTCRMDEANKYLYALIEQNKEHVNFI